MKLFCNALCIASCSIFVAACGGGGGGGSAPPADTTPPGTSISSAPADSTNSTSASFVFASTEAASTFQCSIDGGALANCTSPDDHAGLTEGNHTFSVQATDAAGNTDSTPATHNWEIDLTSPDTNISNGPPNPTNSTNASFEFASTEPGSTFQCSIDGSGDFSAAGTAIGPETDRARDVALGDIDGDGDLDFVVGNWSENNKQYRNDGAGGFSATGTAIGSETEGTLSVALGDVDGDGDLDLVSGNNSDTSRLYLNDGSGGFSATGSALGITFAAALVDIDGDGDLDLVAGNPSQTNKLYLNDGSGAFDMTGTAIGSETDNTWSIALGDIDGDGDVDLVAGNNDETNKLYLNDGSGGFSATGIAIGSETDSTQTVALGDVDGDGDLDLVVGNYSQANKLYRNDGSGGFSPAGISIGSEADRTFSVALGDIDRDGDLDLVAGNDIQVNRLYLNDSSGGFSATGIAIGSESDPTDSVVLGDIDGDGDLDLVTGNDGIQQNKLYLNGSDILADCGSPNNYAGLAEGNHTFRVQATDAAGNVDSTPATYNWEVDITPPDTSISSGPANPTNSTNASFVFTATEPGSTFQCSLDGSALANCTSPDNYAGLAEGIHSFSVQATDAAGNTDTTPATYNWEVDITPPDTSISSGPASLTNLTGVSFVFTSTEAGSTFQCSLDGSALANCTSPDNYAGLAEGNHTFGVRATDAAGNTDATPATFNWEIDVTPPDTSISSGPASLTNLISASFVFTSTEAGSTFQCSLDGAALFNCNSPVDYVGLAEGNHTFSVEATDAAGNTDPTPAIHNWTIDLTPPVVLVPLGITVIAADASGAPATEPAIQTFLNGATATDNVDGDVTSSISNDAPSTFPIGITTVTFSVTDIAGNSGSNSSAVEVIVADIDVPDTTSIVINNDALYGVSVSEFTARLIAMDNVGVTDYLITEHNSTDPFNIVPPYLDPLSSDGRWVAVAETAILDITIQFPLTQTYSLGDTVDLCAWFMDAQKNISARVCDSIIYGVDWGGGLGSWGADNGVWQVGTPTVVGPASCFSGTQCAGTVLDGNYPADTVSRLISAGVQMPTVTGSDEIHLRFRHWFSYGTNATGQVQVSVWDLVTSTWGGWISEGTEVTESSGGWSLKDVDLTAYSGNRVRIGFLHTGTIFTQGPGWYVDALTIVQTTPAFTGTFETGWDDWSAGNGVWQVGTPTVVGPASCFSGTQCAGTVLGGNYPADTVSRLVSASNQLPAVTGGDEIHLRFRHWFSYGTNATGQVQVSVWDLVTSTWGGWISEGTEVTESSGGWSLKDVDLTAYSGNRVRIGFLHTGTIFTQGPGWYVDALTIVQTTPAFTGTFETGWDDWSAGNGVWQVGTPTVVGPASCFSGTQCAGTVLGGNYPADTVSRLVSASNQLPAVTGFETIRLSFDHWFSYGTNATGQVQVSVWDSVTSTWGGWISEGTAVTGVSGGWTTRNVDLTAYSGNRVRIGFLHTGTIFTQGPGWYVDDIAIAVF